MMLTIWTSAESHRKWVTRVVTAALMAALAFTGLAMTSQSQAQAAGEFQPSSVRWR